MAKIQRSPRWGISFDKELSDLDKQKGH